MFQAVLYTQWKWARLPLLVATVAAFALPVLSVQSAGRTDLGEWAASYLLTSMSEWAVFYPLLATGVGLLLALTAWGPDHRLGHAYALSLPIPRWHYALLRLGAGLVLLLAPVASIALGSVIATAAVSVPTGLTAYPLALAIRFALAALLAFTVFFAISSGRPRTAGYVLATMVALIVTHQVVGLVDEELKILDPVLERLFEWPGPLAIFGGRWMLIDV